MCRLYWLLFVAILLTGNDCFAQGYDEARSYLLRVFNDTYVIPQNNAKTYVHDNNNNTVKFFTKVSHLFLSWKHCLIP
ncbi:MAG: hypothetical protein BWX58_00024 [Deltaproteobacteria bacterium ADurb.Bin026]|nr:MAG: hypothetical protein BWX58_00024 [Deltaproteobacteria bacterium ADurb.Bin026]